MEFALVVPLLLVLVLGIVEFGRAYHVQTTLSGAAREGVREMALHNDPAARPLRHQGGGTAAGADGRPDRRHAQHLRGQRHHAGRDGHGDRQLPMPFITDFFGTTITLTGKGVMRCNG